MSVIQPIEKTADIIVPDTLYGTRAALFFLMREAEKPTTPAPTKTDNITFMANAAFGAMHTVSFAPLESQKHCKSLPEDVPLLDEFVFAPAASG